MSLRPLPYTLFTLALLVTGCTQDMYDQPRYEQL